MGFYLQAEDGSYLLTEDGERLEMETASATKFVGTIAAIRPASGRFEHPAVEVEAHDWMGYASQELGVIPVDDDKRADEAITTALANFPIQPGATDFDEGIETFLMVFNTDPSGGSMAKFLQKMCRNEMGMVYVKGDGTLVFENRNARALTTDSAFTLDEVMTDFVISYERADIFNHISAKIAQAEVDANPTTQLWDLQEQGAPAILPGETLVLTCDFSDPATGRKISALDVVTPIVGYEFGSVGDYVTDDMHADLSQNNTPGSNSMIVRLTNDHANQTGYLNDLTILGKGIYVYDPMTILVIDQDSIDIRGERRFFLWLEQIVDPNVAKGYAGIIKGAYTNPHFRASRIHFLANQTAAIATGAIAAEPSTRFIAIESVTGVSYSFYINRIRYTQEGPNLWVTLSSQPAGLHGTFVWDVSHWDNVEDARWSA